MSYKTRFRVNLLRVWERKYTYTLRTATGLTVLWLANLIMALGVLDHDIFMSSLRATIFEILIVGGSLFGCLVLAYIGGEFTLDKYDPEGEE